jgi:hypothetical protein
MSLIAAPTSLSLPETISEQSKKKMEEWRPLILM